MISKPASNASFDKPGNYIAQLTEINCYTEADMNNGEPLPNLSFVFNLGDLNGTGDDVLFYQGFVTIYLDDEGFPKMGGERSRYYKIVSALYGQRFDPKDESVEVDIGFPEEYNSVEGILQMPSFKDYGKDDERLALSHLKVNGVDIIGKECQLELGYPQKPDGSKGARIAVLEATPMVQRAPRRAAARPAGAPG